MTKKNPHPPRGGAAHRQAEWCEYHPLLRFFDAPHFISHNARGPQCRQAMRTRRCGGISADLTFLVLFWSSKKVQRKINMNARLYDPVIARFFSPDNYVQIPEFTQAFNRYSYCLNNPLKYVDPSGNAYIQNDDIWDFDRNGKFVERTQTTKFDQVRIVDDNKNVVAETDKFKYGTIKHNKPPALIEGVLKALDIFGIKGDNNATEVFETLQNNTNVEWTHAKIGSEGSEGNMVRTSHNKTSTVVGNYLLETGYTLRDVTHNHHNNDPMPSGVRVFEETGIRTKDLHSAELYQNKFPKINLNIYTTEHGYSPYNKYGTLDPRIFKINGAYIIKP
jgi:RHS repeat-associated protein